MSHQECKSFFVCLIAYVALKQQKQFAGISYTHIHNLGVPRPINESDPFIRYN